MEALPVCGRLEFGETDDLDLFLDRAAVQVDNHTTNEAAKAFTLVLAALFERQLSVYARANVAVLLPKRAGYEALLTLCAGHAGINLDGDPMGVDLVQLLVVANVVRHGDGGACERLRVMSPELWDDPDLDYVDLAPGPTPLSEQLRIRRPELLRYIYATARFWGLADMREMAVSDPPYRRW
jgi:hypothetical protein